MTGVFGYDGLERDIVGEGGVRLNPAGSGYTVSENLRCRIRGWRFDCPIGSDEIGNWDEKTSDIDVRGRGWSIAYLGF